MATRVINLEKDMPKVDTALFQLRLEMSTLRRSGVKAVKIIHGYGSSGSGGAIRVAAQQYLRDQLKEGRIRAFCPGEQFGPFESSGREIVTKSPAFRRDPDWGRQNDGITVVLI